MHPNHININSHLKNTHHGNNNYNSFNKANALVQAKQEPENDKKINIKLKINSEVINNNIKLNANASSSDGHELYENNLNTNELTKENTNNIQKTARRNSKNNV